MIKSHVQYGDLLVLEHFADQQNQYKHGYVSATGFIQKDLYLFQSKNFKSYIDEVNKIPLNYRTFVFQITPKLNFDYHKDYYKLLQKYIHLKKKNQVTRFLKKKLEKLSKKMAEENQINLKKMKKMKKKNVYYGDNIQLMHFDSKSYVSGINDYEHNDMIGYNCKLADGSSESMVFQILPKFKTHQIGDNINYDDTIYLRNVIYNAYFNFREEYEEYEYFHKPISELVPLHNWVDSQYEKKKIFLSQEKDCNFNIKLFQKNFKPSNFVSFFDYIVLEHTELSALLTADNNYQFQNQQEQLCYLRKYTGSSEEELCNLNSIWIIEPHEDKAISERVQALNSQNKSQNDQNYVLRHFSTGKFLSFIQINNELCIHLDQESTNSNLEFQPLENNEYLLNKNLYYITKKNENLYFKGCLNDSKDFDFESQNEQNIEIYQKKRNIKLFPLKNSDLEIKKYGIVLNNEEEQENVFKIKKVSEDIIQKILFVKSGVQKMRLFLDKFKDKQNLKDWDLMNAIQILQIIIKFIFNIDESQIVNYYQIQFEPVQQNQKLLRDIYFIDILIEIFYLSFNSYNIQNYDSNQNSANMYNESNDLLLNFIKMSFSAMRYTIGEYRPNELYASQWLQFLMKNTLETKEKSDTLIGLTLTELIDNNTKILETRIKTSTIKLIIEGMKFDTTNLYFIDLLKAICICNNKPMFFNQKITTNLLLNDESYRDRGFKFFMKGNTIKVRNQMIAYDQNKKAIEKVYSKDLQLLNPHEKKYQYILNFCQLIADLCMNRNYSAIKFAQQQFPKEVLLQIIKNDDYNYEIREVVLNMLINIWMDREPYQFQNKPRLLIFLNKSSKKDHENQDKKEKFDSIFADINLFLWDFLNDLKPNNDLSKINFQIKVIDTLIKLIHIQYINKKEEFQKLFQILLKILDYFVKDKQSCKNLTCKTRKIQNKEYLDLDNLQKRKDAFYVKIFELIKVILKFSIASSYEEFIKDYFEKFQNQEKKFRNFDVAKLGKKVVKTIKKKIEKLSPEEIEINKFRNFYLNSIKDKKIYILDYKILNQLVYYPIQFFVKSQNKDILMSSLTLINELFYQNKKFMSFFKKIAFVYDEDHYSLYKLLQKNSMGLFQKLELIENWYNLSYVRDIQQIIKNLNIFLQQKKEMVFQIQIGYYEQQLLEYQLLQEEVDFEFLQKLFDYLNIIPNLFKVLFYDNHYQKELKNQINKQQNSEIQIDQQNDNTKKLQDVIMKVLNEVYQMMYFYQKGNIQTTKNICKNYIDTINKHFKRKVFYSMVLLQDLLKDNKDIIFNEQNSEKIINNVLKSLQDPNQEPVILIQSLKIVNTFLDYKGYKIKKHQAFFIFKLLKNQYFVNIKTFLKEVLVQTNNQGYYTKIYIEKMQDKVYVRSNFLQEDNQQDTQVALLVKEKVNLFLAMMQTIFVCIDKNHFVKNLCLGILDLNGFLQVYKFITFENGLPFKIVFMKYLKLVILQNKEQNQIVNENLMILWKELKQDYEQIDFFLQNEQKNFNILTITHNKLTTLKQLFTYYFNCFIDCVNIVINCIKQQNDQNNMNDVLDLKNTLKNFGKQINTTLQELQINTKKHDELLAKVHKLVVHQRRKSSLMKQRNNTSYTIQLNQKRSSFRIDLFDRQNKYYQRKSTQLQQKMKMEYMFDKFQRSGYFKQIQADEYNCLIGFLKGLDEIKDKGFDFRLKQFLQNLIVFTMKEEKKNENIVLIATKLLRNILEIDSGYHGDFVLSELDEDQILNSNDIFNRQNSFSDLGIAKFVCNLLKEKDFSLKTKRQLLLMANNYLYGGNKKMQQLFIEYFYSDVKNERIEIFCVLSQLLETCFQKVKKRIQRRNKEKLNNFYKLKKDQQELENNIEDIKSKVEDFHTNYEICKLIYRFFQLLCEGHNIKIQNFLRVQFDSEEHVNTNIIEMAVNHWGSLIKFLNADCAQLGLNILEFLIESIEGPCYENQQEVYSKKMVDYSKDFMRDFSDVKDCQIRGFNKDSNNFQYINDLIALNIKLLNTLIEANDDLVVYKKMAQKINFDLLMDKLCDYYEEFREENIQYYKDGNFQRLDKNAFRGKISEAFNIMIFIRNIDYKTHMYSFHIQKLNKYQKEVYDFFYKNTANIEIVFKEKIYMVYFTIQPACHLSMSVKKNFLSEINIEAPFDKLNGIIQNSAVLFEQMDHLNSLQNVNKRLTPDLFYTVGNYSYCVILIINIIMVLFLRADIKNNKVVIQFTDPLYSNTIDYLGIVNLGLNVIQLILWFILEFYIYISKNFNKQLSKLKKKIQNYKEPTDEILTAQKILQNSFLYLSFKDKLFILKLSAKLDGFDNTIPLIEYFFSLINFMCENHQFLFLVFLILLNVFAYLKKFYIFYCFPLFNIIVIQKDSLQNTLKRYQINYLSWKTTFININTYYNIFVYIYYNRLSLYRSYFLYLWNRKW